MGLLTFYLHLLGFKSCRPVVDTSHASRVLELVQNYFEGWSIPAVLNPTLLCNAPNFLHLRNNPLCNARADSSAERSGQLRRRFDVFKGNFS